MIDHCDCIFMVDNEVLCGLCCGTPCIEGWTHTHLSGRMGRVISSLPASLRFGGALNVDSTGFHANGVRYAKIQCAIFRLRASDQGREGAPRALSVAEINEAFIAPANISEVLPAVQQVHGMQAAGPRRCRPERRRPGVGMIKSR
jgi:tubulin alpha